MPDALATSVSFKPEQIVVPPIVLLLILIVKRESALTLLAAILSHPLLSITVTLYILVTVAITVSCVLAVLHKYFSAPTPDALAISVSLIPEQIAPLPIIVTVGVGFMTTLLLTDAVQPTESVMVTLYILSENTKSVSPVAGGLQLNVEGPVPIACAISVSAAPIHEVPLLTVTFGTGYTNALALAVLLHPFLSVTVTA